jgi:hypothetical protein
MLHFIYHLYSKLGLDQIAISPYIRDEYLIQKKYHHHHQYDHHQGQGYYRIEISIYLIIQYMISYNLIISQRSVLEAPGRSLPAAKAGIISR